MAIHDVRELLSRRRRRVSIRWRGAAPDPTTHPRPRERRRSMATACSGRWTGDVSEFVRAVASPSLEDLTIEPASLEEAFLEYYAGDGG